MTGFLIYDVFTDRAFCGNPLAVVLDADRLPEGRLQGIAREFNFSETTFVFPPADPAHTARVRIFTPATELPFAGHPTIGTAVALSARGRGRELILELGVGPIPVSVSDASARFVSTTALTRGTRPPVAEIAACLDLPEDQIVTKRHDPEMAGVGLSFCMVELASDAAVSAASANLAAFRLAADRYRDRANFGVFCYARRGSRVNARMFAPTGGIPEDPATGSAAAALTAYLATLERRSLTLAITQGVDMGRPSRIDTDATFENGQVAEVAVAGQAIKVAEGRLTLD